MAKLKLCQIVAILTGKKTATETAKTNVYHRLQKPILFQGLTKRYSPKDEEGESFPDERQNIQQRVADCLAEIRAAMVDTMDLTATQDKTNASAKASVVVDGRIVLPDVPVTHMLWLEKQLTDLRTELANIPVLDPQEKWTFDANAACFVSEPVETNKTKKVPKTLVKYDATDKHPAQTEMYHEDVVVGRWTALKFSAAMPAQEKNALLARVVALRDAVKLAREEANGIDVVETKYGDAVFDFILGVKK